MTARQSRKRAFTVDRRLGREVTLAEERQQAVLVELGSLDPSELSKGDEELQIAAHGPDGDAVIASVGADAQGLRFEEEPPAEEVRREFVPR
jgi:hypothetical protein